MSLPLYGVRTPARRPRWADVGDLDDNFLMDFENSILSDWCSMEPHPTGRRRFQNPEWAKLVQRNCYPQHSDIDWFEYMSWCLAGGGDEWFQTATPDSMETLNGSTTTDIRNERPTRSEEPPSCGTTPGCECHLAGSTSLCRESIDNGSPTTTATAGKGDFQS